MPVDSALPLRGLRILVADDDFFVSMVLQELLRCLGASVVGVSDGSAALRVLREAGQPSVDLVVCDLEMPEVDGFKVLRAVRGPDYPQYTALPFVAVTAHRNPSIAEHVFQAGANGLLVKPIGRSDLLSCLLPLVKPAQEPE